MPNITLLSDNAKSQPHAAYSALVHGLSSRWSYLSRVTPNISHLLIPLDTTLTTELLPTLTGRSAHNDQECALFALPARHGGLGIRIPSKNAEKELVLQLVTSSLVSHILGTKPGVWIPCRCKAAYMTVYLASFLHFTASSKFINSIKFFLRMPFCTLLT